MFSASLRVHALNRRADEKTGILKFCARSARFARGKGYYFIHYRISVFQRRKLFAETTSNYVKILLQRSQASLRGDLYCSAASRKSPEAPNSPRSEIFHDFPKPDLRAQVCDFGKKLKNTDFAGHLTIPDRNAQGGWVPDVSNYARERGGSHRRGWGPHSLVPWQGQNTDRRGPRGNQNTSTKKTTAPKS